MLALEIKEVLDFSFTVCDLGFSNATSTKCLGFMHVRAWELSPSSHVICGLCEGFKLPGSSVQCLCNCGWQAWVGTRVHSCEKWWPWQWRLELSGKIQGHTDFVCSGIYKDDFENELKVGAKMNLFLFYRGRCQVSSWDLWTFVC